MTAASLIDPSGVPPDLLRRYLNARGWRSQGRRADHLQMLPSLPPERLARLQSFIAARSSADRDFDVMVHDHPALSRIQLIFPMDSRAPDFRARIAAAVQTLASIEERSWRDIVLAIRSMGFDAIFSRLPDVLVRSATVSLNAASRHVPALKAVLLASANTELDPTAPIARTQPDAASYVEACRFGHTFEGSFGFTIESPLPLPPGPALLPEAVHVPFERRVVTRILRGLRLIERAGHAGEPEMLVNAARSSFGATALDAAAELVESVDDAGLSIDFSLSPELPAAPDVPERLTLTLGRVHSEVARAASRALRERLAPEDVEIQGEVVRLRNERNPQLLEQAGSGEVSVKWVHPLLGEIRVAVRLSAEDYLKALRAHGEGRSIRVGGTLQQRPGGGWILSSPSALLEP